MSNQAQTKNLELKTVWVFECIHDLHAGIFKNVVSGPNPSKDEKLQNKMYASFANRGFGGPDESNTTQEEVLFIDGEPRFFHT